VLTKKDELQLAVFERKVLREIFGPETLISGGGSTMKNCTNYMQNQKLLSGLDLQDLDVLDI
jgi:hypothetical protein